MHFFLRNYYFDTYLYKQSIGFIGPGVSLLCLNYANTPTTAAVLLTIALCLSSFSQAGFLLNIQVSSTQLMIISKIVKLMQ